ncbi:hypothetical protein B0O99DRAFT_683154 [Bisporella sp. PMI_857]|nr:hypothetical protein B0O99DRAFT_683154 [Bisporella sp. PMI_857]
MAETDAMAKLANGTLIRESAHNKRAVSFWMEDTAHNDHFLFGPDSPGSYPVFRNVKDPLSKAVAMGVDVERNVVLRSKEQWCTSQRANAPPTLVAAKNFIRLGPITSDVYTGENNGEGECNFLRQVRNFIIDISKADLNDCLGIHWQVAQATSIYIHSVQSVGQITYGYLRREWKGGFMSDLAFKGGALGIRCGNQQFTTQNFRLRGCKIAIGML